jgi:drug/metabolite transporter (DMT)-like permease
VLSSRFLPPLAVAGTVISWAAAFPAIRFALREVDPLPLAAIRFALAAVFAIAWLAWSRPERPSIRDFYLIVVCGALGIAAYNMLLNAGQTTVSAGAASFIVNTQPLFMVLLALVFLGERFTGWSWVGAALGFGGVAMIASGQPGGFNFGTGTNFIVAAAFCAAAFSVIQRPLIRRIHPLTVTSFVLLAGAVIMLPWLPGGARQLGGSSATTIGCIIFLAVAPAAIGQTCWTFAIKSFGAARAGQFLYLIPPMAVLFSWAVIAEVPSWSTIYGGLFALLGVVIVNTWGRA